jgi:membrane-associated phospholipid phosphatase
MSTSVVRPQGTTATERAVGAQAPRLPRWWAEVALVAMLYAGYDATRGLRHGSVSTANHNGWLLLHWEQTSHLAPEHALNQLLWHVPALAVLAAYFYATLHFVVTPAVLIWLYRRHPSQYVRARTVLAIATVAALIGFWLLPTTPPRLLPGSGIRDTLADVHQWGWWSGPSSAPRGLGSLANEFAAMPSLHAAWALWAGWLIARYARHRAVRIAGVAYPILTGLVVMSTGNHYLLDVLAGAAVISLAAAIVARARFVRLPAFIGRT